MDDDQIKFRHCSMCPYKEPRGSRQGAFIAGKFVCDDCYNRQKPPRGPLEADYDRLRELDRMADLDRLHRLLRSP